MALTKTPIELSSTPGIVDNSNATAITIDSSENVGIGLTNPSDYYAENLVVAAGAEGAPCWKVFWPQCHTEGAYMKQNAFGKSGFPFKSKEYTNPESVDYSKVDVPNAVWHQSNTFTCFAFPTFTEEDCQQIGAALAKVIRFYSK